MSNWFDLDSPYCDYASAKAVIIPAPYEGTVTYGRGTSNGPDAIFKASPNIELYDSILGKQVYELGIHGKEPLNMPEDPERAVMAVKSAVMEQLETARRPVVVGGEHSLTAGAVAACLENYPNLSVLQLDAHADLRDEYEGTPFSHACVMKRVADLGAQFVQVGIRSMSIEEREWLDRNNRDVISSRQVRTDSGWVEKAVGSLSNNVYLTFDVDALDPSEIPSTGTPEPGGMSYHDVIDLVLALRDSGKHVVGFDVMELAPIPGIHHADFLCASIIYTMIGAFFGD